MRKSLGYLFAFLALAALVGDIWRGPLQGEAFSLTSLAEHWASLHRASLIGLNSTVEKMLSPDIWDSVVLPLISLPTFGLMGALALIFQLLSRRG